MKWQWAILVALGAAGAACGGGKSFVECEQNADCNLGPQGLCETNPLTQKRWCTYPCGDLTGGPDPACASGRCWSDFDVGDGVAGTCVLDMTADAGVGGDAMATGSDARVNDACVPNTCQAVGAECGEVADDGCGYPLDCGVCVLPLMCGAGGVANTCGGTCTPGEWTSTDVEAVTGGSRARIALDKTTGRLHMVYQTDAGLKYAWRANDGTAWQWGFVVDPNATLGADIVTDSQGVVHVAYLGSGTSPQHASLASPGSNWIRDAPPGSAGDTYAVCMAIDKDDGLHMVFGQTNFLYAYRPAGGSWSSPAAISTGLVQGLTTCAITVDDSLTVHAAYSTGQSSFARFVYLRKPQGGVWASETLFMLKRDPALATDASGHVHLTYSNIHDLPYRTRSSGPWQTETIETVANADYTSPSIAVDSSGTVHIIVVRDGNVDYARGSFGSWSVGLVGTPLVSVTSASLAIDDAGGLHVGYLGADGWARYAYRCPD